MELRGNLLAHLLDQVRAVRLARAINGHKEIAVARCRPTLRDVDVKTDRISLEGSLLQPVIVRLVQV
jgi:hypothetical protein